MRRFTPGEPIVLRERWRDRIWAAFPAIAVEDRDDAFLNHVPHGVTMARATGGDGSLLRLPQDGWSLTEVRWTSFRILGFHLPGRPYAVLLFWEPGTDAFAVINTLMGMAIDVETRQPIIGNIQGGLSGPAIRPIALLKVHQVYQECRERGIPIIGQGGIETARDALEFLLAGATAVGIGTALFYDPLAPMKVNAGIEDYLRAHRFPSVTNLVGALEHGKVVPSQAASG